MPLYNKAPYVRKAVESVVGQTYSNWELVVVDDCSTDGSGDIVASFTDSRIRLVRLDENGGVGGARNKGVELSGMGDLKATSQNEGGSTTTAPYICFLDADDWWQPTFLEEMAGLIERHPDAGIYGTGYYIVKNGKKRIAPIGVDKGFTEGDINYCQVYAKTLCMPLWTGAVCMPRKIFNEAGGFPINIKLGEDFLLWIHVALKHKVVLLNMPLSNYNQDVSSAFRGTHNKRYNPDTFMTFHFDQFKEEEETNNDLKLLLDRIRVYTLMNFRQHNLYPDRVWQEIAKVDFSNVKPIYRFYYQAPFWIVRIFCTTRILLSKIKQTLKR